MNLSELSNLLPGTAHPSAGFCRIVGADYSSEIDESAHTVLFSWRYNPRGEFGVLYLSSSPGCAWREKLKQVHGRAQDLRAQVIGTFQVRIPCCLDLLSEDNRARLDLNLADITHPNDFAKTQSLAREARRLGFEAIIAPSAIGADCFSLVVFKDKLAPGSSCLCDRSSIRPWP